MHKQLSSTQSLVVAVVLLVVTAGFAYGFLYTLSKNSGEEASQSQVVAQDSFRFAAVGDFDFNANTTAVLRSVAEQKVAMSLALGDYSYDKTPDEQTWCDQVKNILGSTYPFQLVAGNHDVHESGNKQDINRFAACLPNRYANTQGVYAQQYFFDQKRLIRFVVIAPDLNIDGHAYNYSEGAADRLWLDDAIQSARKNGIRWVVVAMHKNCYTVGQKQCEIGESLMDYLAKNKVDVVLQGHEHGYSRTHQLGLSEKCSSLTPINKLCAQVSSTSEYRQGKGFVLSIVGTGGAELRPVDQAKPDAAYFADMIGSNVDPTYGSLIFNVTTEKMSAEFVGTDKKVHDRFSVVR